MPTASFEPSSLVFPHWYYILKGLRENEYTCKSLHLNENNILLLGSYYYVVIKFKMNTESCTCLLLIDLLIELWKVKLRGREFGVYLT